MSEIRKDITIEKELSGWWAGRATVDSLVDDKAYADFFDVENLDTHQEHMIKAISEHNLSGNSLGDIVPADTLNEYAREQIKEQIENGNMFGTIYADGNELEWAWEPEITLDGKDVDFQDELSDSSKEHIVKEMLDNQCHQGEVCELVDFDYTIYVETENFKQEGEVIEGTYDLYCECDQISSFNEDGIEFDFRYNQETGDIEFDEFFETDLNDAIKETIQDAAKEYVHQKDVVSDIEISSLALTEGYMEGSVTVMDGNGDKASCVYIFDTETHEVELQKNSAPGWMTGASYEMPLPDVISRNIEEVVGAVEERCENLSLDDKLAGFVEMQSDANDGLESVSRDDEER